MSTWYLPAKNELNKMYIYTKANNLIARNCTGSKNGGAQCLLGGYSVNMWYWSSTEDSGSNYGACGPSGSVLGLNTTTLRLTVTLGFGPFGLLTI